MEEEFVVVEWESKTMYGKTKYSTLPIRAIYNHKELKFEHGQQCQVYYNGNLFSCFLKHKGTKIQCYDLYISFLNKSILYEQKENFQSKSEISRLLTELEAANTKINSLESELKNSKQENEELKKTNMPGASEKLLDVAINIINTLGSSTLPPTPVAPVAQPITASSFKMVFLSENFQDKVPVVVKNDILANIYSKKFTYPRIFRKLVMAVIPDEKLWAHNNKETILKNYPILNACIDFVQSHYSSFTRSEAGSILTNITGRLRRAHGLSVTRIKQENTTEPSSKRPRIIDSFYQKHEN